MQTSHMRKAGSQHLYQDQTTPEVFYELGRLGSLNMTCFPTAGSAVDCGTEGGGASTFFLQCLPKMRWPLGVGLIWPILELHMLYV